MEGRPLPSPTAGGAMSASGGGKRRGTLPPCSAAAKRARTSPRFVIPYGAMHSCGGGKRRGAPPSKATAVKGIQLTPRRPDPQPSSPPPAAPLLFIGVLEEALVSRFVRWNRQAFPTYLAAGRARTDGHVICCELFGFEPYFDVSSPPSIWRFDKTLEAMLWSYKLGSYSLNTLITPFQQKEGGHHSVLSAQQNGNSEMIGHLEVQSVFSSDKDTKTSERQDLSHMHMSGDQSPSVALKTQVFVRLLRKTLSLQIDLSKDVVNLMQEIEKRLHMDVTRFFFFFTFSLGVLEEKIPLSSYGIRRDSQVQMRCRLRGGKRKAFETLHQFFEVHESELLRKVKLPDGTHDVELTGLGYLLLSSWIHCFTATFVAGKTWSGLFDLKSFKVVKGRVMIGLKPKEGLDRKELAKDVKQLIEYIRAMFTLNGKFPAYLLHLLQMLEQLDVDIISLDQQLALDTHASLIPSMNLVSLIYHIKRKYDGWPQVEKDRFKTVADHCKLPVNWLQTLERVPVFCDVISKALSRNSAYETTGSGAFLLSRNYYTHTLQSMLGSNLITGSTNCFRVTAGWI